MRILIINTLYHPYKIGGAEVSVQLLAEGLINEGHSVRVLSLHDGNVIKEDTVNGVEVCYLPLKNIYWPYSHRKNPMIKRLVWHLIDQYNPFMANMVGKEIDKFVPDIVHTNNLAGFSVSVWDTIKKRNIKLIHTARDYYLFHPNCTLFSNGKNTNIDSISVRLWSFFKKIKSSKVDHFVGISNFISDLHQSNGFSNNADFSTIYNPVPKLEVVKEVRKSDVICIGFIGRLSVEKGFDEFCTIASRLKRKHNNSRFIAAGRLDESKEGNILRKQALDLGIELLGFTTLESFLTQVDAVILPTKWREPFGRTVVECSYHVPVFTNPQGGVKELMLNIDNVKDITQIEEIFLSHKSKEQKLGSYSFNFGSNNCCYSYLKVYSHCG